jgi:hypothetical protein
MRVTTAVLGAALTSVVGLVACEPAMEVTVNVSRDIVLLPDEQAGQTGSTLLFSGQAWCTRSEPIDLWITVDGNRSSGASIPCDGPDGNDWTLSRTFTQRFEPGGASVSWQACTNPSSAADEDCITVERASSEIRAK